MVIFRNFDILQSTKTIIILAKKERKKKKKENKKKILAMNMVKAGGETGQQIVDNMSSQQSTSSTSNNIYATNNNPQKELIEDKKRKMTLPLDSGGGGGGDGQMNSQNQNNLTLQQGSNMLTGFTPTNSKKIKTYFTPVGLVNAPSNEIYPFLFKNIKKGELKNIIETINTRSVHSTRKNHLIFSISKKCENIRNEKERV